MVERRSTPDLAGRTFRKEREELPRVFVVGMGLVGPLGLDVKTSWENLIVGKTGISKVDIDGTSIRIAGKIDGFNSAAMLGSVVVSSKEIRRMSRTVQLGLAAVVEAFHDAGLPTNKEELSTIVDVRRFGVCGGTGIGGANEYPRVSDAMKNGKRPSPFDVLIIDLERVATVVSMKLGLKGPLNCVSVACATGNRATTEAYKDMLADDADLMAVVTAESTLDPVTLESFNSMHALSNSDDIFASRPFDKRRNGFVMAEAAACLLLAREEIVKKLRLRRRAELVAYGNTADAGDSDTEPTGQGAEEAMRIALKRLGQYDPRTFYVNAHATSTPKGDIVEIMSVRKVFGEDTQKLAISSTKGASGHGLGAASTMEAVFCIKAIEEGILPPTANLEEPMEEGEGLNLVPKEAQRREVDTAMNNSFGFGGINSVTIFKRPE